MRCAIFVDAGYLFAQGSVLLTGGKQDRRVLSLDIPQVTAALKDAAKRSCDLPLLRIYWYDAMRLGRMTPEQAALAHANDIKMRLGQINSEGRQKGVDALIITDLAELARNRAVSDAVLLSGDEDVRVGVVLAQQFGVRVHLLGIQPARANQSPSLMQEADTTAEWDAPTVGAFLTSAPESEHAGAGSAAVQASLDEVVRAMIMNLSEDQVTELQGSLASGDTIPAAFDRMLLRIGREYYAQDTLNNAERSGLRAAFIRLVRSRS